MNAWITRLAFVIALAAVGAVLGPSAGVGSAGGALLAFVVAASAAGADLLLARAGTAAITGGALGLAAGLLLAILLRAAAFSAIPASAQPLLAALVAAALGFAGAAVGAARLPHVRAPQPGTKAPAADAHVPAVASGPPSPVASRSVPAKLVDTSVIIDGRIADIIEAGFIEGAIVIPQFVLRELQQVADSSDPLKRNRGRKGLDVLRVLQSSQRVRVEFTSEDSPDIREVDAKLVWLAEQRGARILTNDYNLNKVAQLQGIEVLNVNDLANALRPVVLPGEPLTIQVIKEGKERNQGVGYLDDGTMVVVENGKRLLGQRLDVLVTSVIQTNAGKMIFATADDEIAPEQRPRVLRRAPDALARTERDALPAALSPPATQSADN